MSSPVEGVELAACAAMYRPHACLHVSTHANVPAAANHARYARMSMLMSTHMSTQLSAYVFAHTHVPSAVDRAQREVHERAGSDRTDAGKQMRRAAFGAARALGEHGFLRVVGRTTHAPTVPEAN